MKLERGTRSTHATQIASFTCTGELSGWAKDVEDAIRSSFDYCSRRAHRELWVIETEDKEVVAAAVASAVYVTDPGYAWLVDALAVRLDCQDRALGRSFLFELISRLGQRYPGVMVAWFVHRENTRMAAVSASIGAVPEQIEEPPAGHVGYLARPQESAES